MKRFKILIPGFILFMIMNNVMAQDVYSLSAHVTTINGTSNLHNWHSTVEKISGKGEVKPGADKSLSLEAFNIVVQVNSIKGDGGSGMDGKTFKALKADKFHEITFVLTDPVVNIPYGSNAYTVAAKGRLTIAGVTKPITMSIKIATNEDKKLIVEGAQPVKMTDYGVDPPTAMLGMLKTGDVITINFKTTFSLLN
jgi:polyisoprenoid-binding protein YceI